jgi:hypothetical protein
LCATCNQVLARHALLKHLSEFLSGHLLASLQFETDPRAIHAYLPHLLASVPAAAVPLSLRLASLLQTRPFVATHLLRSAELYALFVRAFAAALSASASPDSPPGDLPAVREGTVTFLALPLPPGLPGDALQLRAQLEGLALAQPLPKSDSHAEIIALLRNAAHAPDHDTRLASYTPISRPSPLLVRSLPVLTRLVGGHQNPGHAAGWARGALAAAAVRGAAGVHRGAAALTVGPAGEHSALAPALALRP